MVNKYNQKHKEKLRKEAPDIYQNISEEEKDKERQYGRERNKYLFEKEKKKKKRLYGRERYKNLLEDKYRKSFSKIQEIKTS